MTVKEQILSQLQELRQDVRTCIEEVKAIKAALPMPRIHVKPNFHPSNMRLSRKVWERAFVRCYGEELFSYFATNIVSWVTNGVASAKELRKRFYHNSNKPIGIRTVIKAHREFCAYHGVIVKTV